MLCHYKAILASRHTLEAAPRITPYLELVILRSRRISAGPKDLD